MGVGGGGDIEKSGADREITTWKGAAIEHPALTDRQADRQAVEGAWRMQTFYSFSGAQVWMGQRQQANPD